MNKSPVVYQSCSELPLYNFIQLAVNNQLKYMLINTNDGFSEELLLRAWEKILEEYTASSGNATTKYGLKMSIEMASLETRIDLVGQILAFIELNGADEQLFNVLRESGFRYSFSESTLKKDIDRVLTNVKRLIIRHEELKAEMQKALSVNPVEVTEKIWFSQISYVSKFMGFSIDPKTTSTLQYMTYTDLYIKSNQPKSAKNGK